MTDGVEIGRLTPIDPEVFRALALASGLRLYGLHRIRVNRVWTPGAMMRSAGNILGVTFKSRDYLGAAAALKAAVEQGQIGGVECGVCGGRGEVTVRGDDPDRDATYLETCPSCGGGK